VIGFLLIASASSTKDETDGFRRGLRESGYVEGQNIIIEYRWVEAQYDRLPALVTDLVHRGVLVIAAGGSAAPGLAAKAATSTIPVVFQTGSDPVKDGLVATMNRPGGNVTGVSRMAVMLEAKRLELLHELIPNATEVAFLVNPKIRAPSFSFSRCRRQLASSGSGFDWLEPALSKNWRSPSLTWFSNRSALFWSPKNPHMPAGVSKSPRSLRVTGFLRPMGSGSMRRQVV
jgi:putative tryptophan/tyrosine transport system substrate-binding protein